MQKIAFTHQFGSLGNQIHPSIKLLQLVVTARRVGDNFDTYFKLDNKCDTWKLQRTS